MNFSQLEILLFTNTRFSLKQFCERFDTEQRFDPSEFSNLEEACWYGLLWDTMPELYLDAGSRKELVLWKIIEADYFFELKYGGILQPKQYTFSIDPYLFLGPELFS
jgi:hypothetical protein